MIFSDLQQGENRTVSHRRLGAGSGAPLQSRLRKDGSKPDRSRRCSEIQQRFQEAEAQRGLKLRIRHFLSVRAWLEATPPSAVKRAPEIRIRPRGVECR
jgi:hypothetical protein